MCCFGVNLPVKKVSIKPLAIMVENKSTQVAIVEILPPNEATVEMNEAIVEIEPPNESIVEIKMSLQ